MRAPRRLSLTPRFGAALLAFAAFAAFAITATAAGQEDDARRLAVHLRLPSPTYEIGQPLAPGLAFENTGSAPYFLVRTFDYGPKHITLTAVRDGCRVTTTPAHFTQSLEDLRFSYTSLFPEDRLETTLFPLNTLEGEILLDLPGPGRYTLTATFTSEGPAAEGMVWPIWRGEATSPPVEIEVRQPSPETIAPWKERLRRCAAEEPCGDFEALGYFRLVRAPDVAGLIRTIVGREPGPHSINARALVKQGRPEDAAFLEEIARRPGLEARLRDHYLELARELRASAANPCQ